MIRSSIVHRLCLAAMILVSFVPAPALSMAIAPGTETPPPGKAVGNAAADAGGNAALPAAAAAANADLTLLLEVELNGQSTGKVAEFIMHRGRLAARASDLLDLGLKIPDERGANPERLVTLSDLPGVSYTVDQVNLVLHITTAPTSLAPTILRPQLRDRLEDRRVIESGNGATLNYDVVNTVVSGQTGATGSFEARAFSPLGILSSGWLAYAGNISNSAGNSHPVRLDSSYTYADINTLRRYTAGDFITSGLSWSRPVRIAGVQVRSDFSMRPDLITFPMPSVKGAAAVPSSVQVLADGNVVASGQINSGPFEVPQLPVVSGAGTISLAMTNALGQQVVVNQPFYASSAMLAPGLQTFAVQAGPVRRRFGSASYDFGKLAGVGSYRRGMTPKLTLEGTAEGTPGTFVAGGGGVTQIGTLGVVNYSAAGSFGSDHSGGQFSAGAQRIGRKFSMGGSATFASRRYWDVAAMNGNGTVRKQLSAFTSVSLRRLGTAGGAYAAVNQDASPRPLIAGGVQAQNSRIISANYSIQAHHIAYFASLFKTFGDSGSTGLQVGMTIPIGKRNSVDVSASSDGYGQVDVQKPVTDIGDWGYEAYVAAGNSNHEFAQMAHKTLKGLFSAGVDSNEGATTVRLESQGALSFADRGLFLSNWVYDSFAIVDTNPMRHVEVFEENREVGKTGSSGRLLVPDMRAFELNHLSIAANELPADVNIHDASREIRPQDRSGVVVKFAMKISHGALLHLVDESGIAVPVGSAARLLATGVVVPVGYDGDAYVEDLAPQNELSVERPDGRRCSVTFNYRPIPGEIPSVGPLLCKEAKP